MAEWLENEGDAQRGSAAALKGVTIEVVHQLTPELAVDVAAAGVVIFVDAEVGIAPGEVRVRRVDVAGGIVAEGDAAEGGEGTGGLEGLDLGASTHDFSPETLLAMARKLFGARVDGWLVTIGGRAFDHGETMSPEVEAAVAATALKITGLIAEARRG